VSTHDKDRALDAVAEAIVLLDTEDPSSVAELCDRLADLVSAWGAEVSADSPCSVALRAAQRLAAGDGSAAAEIERAFAACRSSARVAAPSTATLDAATDATTSPAMPLAGDDELLRDFAIRAAEHLDDADERLLALESEPADADSVDAVFRAFHTIKGMAGFLALDEISERSHAAEALLEDARKTGCAVPEPTVHALFSAVDEMRALVARTAGMSAPESPEGVSAGLSTESAPLPEAAGEPLSVRAGTVRVEESRLDALLDAIGEMVIAESMVSAATRSGADPAVLEAHIERLDKMTRELQHMATSLRMVPLRATFRRMARLVRDVASKSGKDVEFVVTGEDTEIDKDVVDRISDPLVHALRNAVDHGIESPAERRAAGKPESGRVELRAYHAGGAIHVEVEDDGRGVDPVRILEQARACGLIADEEMPDERTILDLVFSPGLSTATTVTDVSGRGVGMDVVRRTIEDLRGRVDLRSRPGEGSTLAIRLPLTLAIIDGMALRVGEERYVLPLLSIERSVRPRRDEVFTVAGRGEMLAHDDGLVPVMRLHRHFGTPGACTDITEGVVVIVDDNGSRAGLFACELLGQQQTVIKPLGEGLPQQPGVAGGAVMPDGRVGLILDAAGLVRTAQRGGGE